MRSLAVWRVISTRWSRVVSAEAFIAHYASEYYDPVKAKEYYERTKQLKGRKPKASDLKGDKKKGAWEYTKDRIGEAKRNELDNLAEQRREFLEEVRDRASEKRKRISEKLKEVLNALTEDKALTNEQLSEVKKQETKRISEETAAKIDALPEIPKGVSKERRAELVAERKEEVAKIRGEADSQKAELAEAVKTEKNLKAWYTAAGKNEQREGASVEREQVGNELKATIEKARVDFKSKSKQLKAKYEEVSLKEFEAIRTQV